MGSDREALEKKSGFSRFSRHIGQTPCDLSHELVSTDTHGAKSFKGHWEKVVGPAERSVFVCLPSSCSLSCTGPGDGNLLEVGTAVNVTLFDLHWLDVP